MNYIGIDPGKNGAMCIILDTEEIVFYDTPTLEIGLKKRHEYNTNIMAANLSEYTKTKCSVALEKIHSMPGQGVRSMFSMGQGYGIWLGLIAAMELPLTLVTPQAWKKVMMGGMGKEKDASRLRAVQLFPQCAHRLNLKKHHDRADALLIAEYLRQHH